LFLTLKVIFNTSALIQWLLTFCGRFFFAPYSGNAKKPSIDSFFRILLK
jgi:hypothetical protein